jgi:hypothetical protein
MTKKEQAEAGLSLQVSADNLRAVAKSLREKGNLTAAGCREIEAEEMDWAAATYLIPLFPMSRGSWASEASSFFPTKRWKTPRPFTTR